MVNRNIVRETNVTTGGPRVDLEVESFDHFIYTKGYRVLWEQAMFCSCYSRNTGQPSYGCPVCGGLGYVYGEPKSTRVAMSSISGNQHQERIGLNDVGMASMTTLSTDNVGYRDRVTFIDFTTKFTEVVERSGEEYDPLRYPSSEMITVRQLNNILIKDIDYTMDSNDPNRIHWLSNSVVTGSFFSLLYLTKPVYIVMNIEHEIRGTFIVAGAKGGEKFVVLPKKFSVKREDFL